MKPLLSKEEITDLLTPLGAELGTDSNAEPTDKLHIEATRIDISADDLRQLQEGSIIATDQTFDAPLELYVHNTLIGHAERVQIDGKLALKITDLSNRGR